MAQPVDTASIEESEANLPVEPEAAEVPASPASLWASESKFHYSITHIGECDTRAWIDCDCVIHTD